MALIQMPIDMNMTELTYEIDSERMVCSKCGTTSNSEIENKRHYHIQHKTHYTMKSYEI